MKKLTLDTRLYLLTTSIAVLAVALFAAVYQAPGKADVLWEELALALLGVLAGAYKLSARAYEKKHTQALEVSQTQLSDLYLATIKSLALAIDAKDRYTHQHILRVREYAVAIALEMGLSGAEFEAVNTGALLHDIGKLGVPEYVLLKPGRLTPEEFEKVKKHPEIGASILDPVGFPWPVIQVVRHHHEKWDGTGYPDGLAGEDIPLTARIMAVADVFDALTSSRSYRKAWPNDKAIAEIERLSGTHFDPQVVKAFSKVVTTVLATMPASLACPVNDSESPNATEAVREISKSSAELWALYEVAQTLSLNMGIEETLDILAKKMSVVFPDTLCAFALRSTDCLEIRAAAGTNAPFFVGAKSLSGSSTSELVFTTREHYIGSYNSDDFVLASVDHESWRPFRSCLCVPIVHERSALGTLNLYAESGAAFGEHDVQLLRSIADKAAVAIYNSTLYERTKGDAQTDALTGLYNLRYIAELGHKLCKEGRPFSLICLDLDSFKPINDNFGHTRGDEVLKQVAWIFKNVVGERGVVARYGGDEFLIILPRLCGTWAETIAGDIRKAVEEFDPNLSHITLGDLRIGVSIGWAAYGQEANDWHSLVTAADMSMYEDKNRRKLSLLKKRAA